MQSIQEKRIEEFNIVDKLKKTLGIINFNILTSDINETKYYRIIYESLSSIESIRSILTPRTFREVNQTGDYLLSISFYDLDKLSSYVIFSLFKITDDYILPRNGYDMLFSGLCIFSKKMELYLTSSDCCEKYTFNILDDKFGFTSLVSMKKNGKNLYSDCFNKHKINNFRLKEYSNSIPHILNAITARGGIFVSKKKYSLIFLLYPLGLLIQKMNGNLFINNENYQSINFPRKMNCNMEFIFGNKRIVDSFIGKGSRN